MAEPIVTLAGFQLHPPAADGTGCELQDDGNTPGLDGWYEAPAPRSVYTPRSGAPGSYYSPLAFPAERVITCTGALAQTSSAAFLLAQRTLVALCPDPAALYLFSVADDAGTLTAMVQRSDKILTKPLSNVACGFTVALTAPDPYRYDPNPNTAFTTLASAPSGLDWTGGGLGGLDWTGGGLGGLNWGSGGSDGTCTILNNGTAPGSPLLTVRGPTDSGTLSGVGIVSSATGQLITYNGTLNLNDVLVIDTRAATRSAILNGSQDVWTSLSASQWFTVPAQGQAKIQFVGSSTSTTPRLDVSCANTYL